MWIITSDTRCMVIWQTHLEPAVLMLTYKRVFLDMCYLLQEKKSCFGITSVRCCWSCSSFNPSSSRFSILLAKDPGTYSNFLVIWERPCPSKNWLAQWKYLLPRNLSFTLGCDPTLIMCFSLVIRSASLMYCTRRLVKPAYHVWWACLLHGSSLPDC